MGSSTHKIEVFM